MERITNENIKNLVKNYLKGNSGLPDINTWDVSNVTDMHGVFMNATIFNQPLNGWDVSNVTNMSEMFSNATSFNQPLNDWDVSNVTDMSEMFSGATDFNQPLNDWDVSNVIDMNNMFNYASSFNQPLNNWVTSNVTNMRGMFFYAPNFNQPLNNWDVSNVFDMRNMFNGAINFNQPLNDWIVFNDTNMSYMFLNATRFNPSFSPTVTEENTTIALAKQYYDNIPVSDLHLVNSDISIDLSESVYDAVSMENIVVRDYLKENTNNIVFKYNNNIYFSNKNDIKTLVLDGSSIKFGCENIGTSIIPQIDNLFDIPCFNMNSIGIISGLVYLKNIKTILESNDSSERVFEISTEPIIHYASTASLQMLSDDPDAVGASHCQEGQEANVFEIKKIVVDESIGGKRKRKTKKRKTKKSKSKKAKSNSKKIKKSKTKKIKK